MHFSRPPPLCEKCFLRPPPPHILIDLFGITNLLCLSPNKLGMPIYLINKITFPHLTCNNTKCCTHLMSASDQLISPVDSSLSHSQCQQLRTVSLFQLCWVYKQATLTQIIQYHHCSCLDNISSPSLHLATACCPGRTIPSEEDFCSRRCLTQRSRYCSQEPRQFSSKQS